MAIINENKYYNREATHIDISALVRMSFQITYLSCNNY